MGGEGRKEKGKCWGYEVGLMWDGIVIGVW